jgi:hypothetical protein
MAAPSIVDVVYQDLTDTFNELSAGTNSPKQIPRSFSQFVDLSQKLTASMRKDYWERTGGKWIASNFDGWTDVTELFKQLRNDDQHEQPVCILVHERQYFRVAENGPFMVFEGTWSLSSDDQLADRPRDDLHLLFPDPETGGPSDKRVLPERKAYEFHVNAASNKANKLLARIEDPNIWSLSDKCYKVLTDYYRYYRNQLARSGS